MLIHDHTIPAFFTCSDVPAFPDFHPESCLFFDIETTGFAPETSVLFLIGAIYYKDGRWHLTQYMAEQPEEEIQILQQFLKLACSYDTVVHFNGTTFDIPYISKKISLFQLSGKLETKKSVDLYYILLPLKKLFRLKSMKQSCLEPLSGWQREDKLSGLYMVSLYNKYTVSQDERIKDLLLMHNRDDLLGMTHILSLSSYLQILKGEFASVISTERTDDEFLICFETYAPVPEPFVLQSKPGIELKDGTGKLTIPLYKGTLCHFFADFKNYYYLPLEDQAIHKSVAKFTEKAYRVPAKRSTCYIKKTGVFLPQPEELFTPVFSFAYNDKTTFFEWNPACFEKPEMTCAYLRSMLLFLTASL